MGGGILHSGVPSSGSGDWVVDQPVCVDVGRLVCRGSVNGIESQACVVWRSLYVVVVNGNKTLDRRWKCVSERLMACLLYTSPSPRDA